jgi:hypothetical protein
MGHGVVPKNGLQSLLSASLRVQKLAMQYPQHAGKYEWFLRLYEAARTNPLVPPGVFARLRAKYPEHIAKGGDAGGENSSADIDGKSSHSNLWFTPP